MSKSVQQADRGQHGRPDESLLNWIGPTDGVSLLANSGSSRGRTATCQDQEIFDLTSHPEQSGPRPHAHTRTHLNADAAVHSIQKISPPKTDPSGINQTPGVFDQSNVYQPVDDLAELVACEQCAVACEQSLDAWMDHLGERHPVPDRWPSSLIHGRDEEHPYTAVVRSQKRRKPNTIPRPLNSFMLSTPTILVVSSSNEFILLKWSALSRMTTPSAVSGLENMISSFRLKDASEDKCSLVKSGKSAPGYFLIRCPFRFFGFLGRIFAQYIRRVTLRWFPEAHNVHISQRVGLMWRQMDRDVRDQYAKQAVQLQHLHSLEFPDYKYQPRKRARDGLNGSLNPVSNSPSGSSLTPEWLELGEDFPDGKLARFSLDVVPHLTTGESQQPWVLKPDDNHSSFTFASDQLKNCVHSIALLRPLAVSEYGSLIVQDSPDFGQQPVNTTTSFDVQSYPRSNTVLTSLIYDVEDKDPPPWCVSRQLNGPHTLEDLLNAPSFIPSDTNQSAINEPLHVFIQSTSSAPTTLVDTNHSSGSCLNGYQQDSLGFNDTETTYLTLTPSICSFSPDSNGPEHRSSCVKSWSKDCSDSVAECHVGDNDPVMKHSSILTSALECNLAFIKPVEVPNLGSTTEQDCESSECMTVSSEFAELRPSVEVTALTDGTIEFDDIETCGPSPSLDELSRLVLFETKMISSSETTPTSNSSVQTPTFHTATDGTIDEYREVVMNYAQRPLEIDGGEQEQPDESLFNEIGATGEEWQAENPPIDGADHAHKPGRSAHDA
ncbi:uncharacterized protein DEA37_0000690 [Paragonimus westermani]|uniref:Sex-determining region Y protein n=1 Tax=Paragonimus westermani TaxID=34504 RepID=A0A5J4NWS5_9TREM|nr:uncharacterized protein DEA37_0000690 [Paragonimus westermani]